MTKLPPPSLEDILRSIIFNIFLIFGSLVVSVLLVWTFVFPPARCAALVGTIYGGYIRLIEEKIMGIKLEMRGLENLPTDSLYIIAAKHQSAFETLKIPFMRRFNFPVIILKKELIWLPLWGLYPLMMGEVAIDRSQGARALRAVVKGCQEAMEDNRNIIIFPQGTRVKPHAAEPYKNGIAKIYKDLEIPVVPMALNSGVYWGKNAFIKRPGTIVFEFLKPSDGGEPPLRMMEELEERLEDASRRLVAEAEDAIEAAHAARQAAKQKA